MKKVHTLSDTGVVCYLLIKDLERRKLFYESADYHQIIFTIKKLVNKFGIKLHAYALLRDHIHLLGTAVTIGIFSKIIKQLESEYCEYFNFKYRRINQLLHTEPVIEIVNKDNGILSYYRFIEYMPVRTGITEHPSSYPWTSYGFNAYGEDLGLVTPHLAYLSLGSNTQSRWKRYRTSFEQSYNVAMQK